MDDGIIEIAQTDNTIIYATDLPGPGGAHHQYEVCTLDDGALLQQISFQKGPVGEVGANGIQAADLLLICQHRNDCFQRGPYSSAVNEVTGGFIGAAIAADCTRTRRRKAAGVEGTSRKAVGVED